MLGKNYDIAFPSGLFRIIIEDMTAIELPDGRKIPFKISFLWNEDMGIPGHLNIIDIDKNGINVFQDDNIPEGSIECIFDRTMFENVMIRFGIKAYLPRVAYNMNFDSDKSVNIAITDSKGILAIDYNGKEIISPLSVSFDWNPYTEAHENIEIEEILLAGRRDMHKDRHLASFAPVEIMSILSSYGITDIKLPVKVEMGEEWESLEDKRKSFAVPVPTSGISYISNQKVFISYSSDTKDSIAEPLAEELINMGIEIWFDEYSIQAGDSISQEIAKGVENTDTAVLIVSQNFFNSNWAQKELGAFMQRHVQIIPVLYGVEIGEFKNKYSLLSDIKCILFTDLSSVSKEVYGVISRKIENPFLNRQQLRDWERRLGKQNKRLQQKDQASQTAEKQQPNHHI